MKKFFLTVLLILIGVMSNAQNTGRIYKNHSLNNDVLHIEVSDGECIIKFYNDNIVETSFVPTGEKYNPESHAVVLEPKSKGFALKEGKNELNFGTEKLNVQVKLNPFQIKYFKNGKELISEKRGFFNSVHKPLEMVKENIIADKTDKIEFNISKDEVLYGAGARALGMNRRGYRLPLFNRAHYGYEDHSELMNYTMPIVVSGNQYLIHFDNPTTGYLDLDSQKNNTLTYETVSGRKTYQIVVGDNWSDLIKNYTELTGRQPMLPRWALGNFASRFGYHSQDEVVNTVQMFRDEKIPVDAVILDLYWFGKEIQGTMGNLKFDSDLFPKPQKMIQDLNQNNVETVLITEPFILTTSNRWNEAVENDVLAKNKEGKPYTYDFYFGNTGIVDIYSKKGNDWFSAIYKDLIKSGVHGMWGDLGEPEVHPYDIIHAKGNGQEVHNIYGHDWAKLVQNSFNETDKKLRPFILMRAGYSGSQRNGIVPWSGDVNRTWGGLQKQQEISLQMGLQGVAWMHSDLGGFAGDNLDEELYERWLQYGVFQPIYRPHAQEEVPSEPVFRSDETKALAKKAIELRYKLLPYNYNMMYQNHTEGLPLMRPLFFEENNVDLLTYDTAYLWGNDFLVAPIKQSTQKQIEVYLPKSSDWIDFYTKKLYKGGKSYIIDVKREYIPTFVRAGAVVPMAKSMQSTREYKGNDLEFHAYLSSDLTLNNTEVYNDDGATRLAYENGAYELMKLSSEKNRNSLKIRFKDELGRKYKAENKKIELFLYNLTKEPKSVTIGTKTYPVQWKKQSKVLKVVFDWNTKDTKEIQLNF